MLTLSATERDLMLEILGAAERTLLVEINRTDRSEYREMLRGRRHRVEDLIEKLRRVEPPVPTGVGHAPVELP